VVIFLNEERKNKGNFVKQKKQRIPVKKIKKTILEPFETKPDKYEIVESEPKEIEPVEKKTVKKIFDLPLINAVHNDWLEKKLKETKLQETKMKINPQQHKYEIVEYEPIEPEPKEIETVETKPDKYEIVEYETIGPEPKEIEPVEKKTVKKIFDLPLINAVYNDWLEKKLKEKKNLETKMRINLQQHKYEIVEYETIEPEPI